MKKYIATALSLGTITLLFYTMFDLKNQVKQYEKRNPKDTRPSILNADN